MPSKNSSSTSKSSRNESTTNKSKSRNSNDDNKNSTRSGNWFVQIIRQPHFVKRTEEDRAMSLALCRRPMIAAALVFIFVAGASAQTTPFTYQGRLTDTGNLANG